MIFTTVNVTLDIFCSFILLMLILYVYFLSKPRQYLGDVFVLLCLSNIAMLLGDIPNWLCEGFERPWFPAALHAGSFVQYAGGLAAIFFYTLYVEVYLRNRGKINRTPFIIAYMFTGIGLLLLIANLWSGIYYYIDAENRYNRGNWWALSQVVPIIVMLLDSGIVLNHRHSLRAKDIGSFLGYEILPISAIVIQTFHYGLALTYPAVSLSILIIFLNIQSEQALLLKRQKHELAKSRIAVMRSQIQPHFLFNVLTGIRELCATDPKQAEQAVDEFSVYLRGNLDSLSSDDLISFMKELEHTKHYLHLEQMRFGKRLRVIYDIGPTAFTLPQLSIQAMVENAVRYGVTKKKEGGTVTIATTQTADDYVVTISDDGVGFDLSTPLDSRTHVGIQNARNRLHIQCGGTLAVSSTPGKGTTVRIAIPKDSPFA